MAEQRAKEGGGDKKNGGSNEESLQALPTVNDSKGKRKVEFGSEPAKDIPSSSSTTELKRSELNERSEQSSNAKEGPEELSEWDDPMAVELEKLLIPLIKVATQTAIKKIVERGFTKDKAEWAVLSSGIYQGYLDISTNIFNGAWAALFCTHEFDPFAPPLFDGIDSLASYILLEMVFVLKEVKPFLSVSEAMWLLLLSDLNMLVAVHHGTVNPNPVLCSCCTTRFSQCKNQSPTGTGPQSADISRESGAGRKGSSVKDLLHQKTNRGEVGSSKDGKGKRVGKTIITTSIDVTFGKPLSSQPSSSAGKNKKKKKKKKKKNSKEGVISVLTPGKNTPASSSTIPSSIPITEKDEKIGLLMLRKQVLQQELQGWSDWASVKVKEATQKLSKGEAELRMLMQERQEADNFEAVMEENIMKRHSELEGALSDCNVQMGVNNSAFQRLEAERTKLKKGIADSEMKSAECSVNLQEALVREEELMKQCQTLEGETSSLQEDLAGLKGKGANLQAQIEKARRREGEFEALRQHEEREKTKILQKAESIRTEREQLMNQAKVEEDNLRGIAEANRLQFEESKNKLTAEISALKLAAASRDNPGQGGFKREWECVMCLTEANSVIFLPCAHQVLCKDCNVVHENRGMKNCPSCRTPIVKRINPRFPPPTPH